MTNSHYASSYTSSAWTPLARILVVDDEAVVGSFLRRALSRSGYHVDVVQSGESALARMAEQMPDLVILDLMLPGIDGYEVVRRIRELPGGRMLPVVMLTARGTTRDRVTGLEAGADDYMVKPFPYEELLARVRAQLRRRHFEAEEVLEATGIRLDLHARELDVGTERFLLTTKEFQLLELFMRHPRRVLTRQYIADKVWGSTFDAESNVIDVWIHRIRQKLDRARGGARIYTVRGAGYVLR